MSKDYKAFRLRKKKNMILEICANSYQSAINAQNAGADRIELYSDLTVGRITPFNLLLKKFLKILQFLCIF